MHTSRPFHSHTNTQKKVVRHRVRRWGKIGQEQGANLNCHKRMSCHTCSSVVHFSTRILQLWNDLLSFHLFFHALFNVWKQWSPRVFINIDYITVFPFFVILMPMLHDPILFKTQKMPGHSAWRQLSSEMEFIILPLPNRRFLCFRYVHRFVQHQLSEIVYFRCWFKALIKRHAFISHIFCVCWHFRQATHLS